MLLPRPQGSLVGDNNDIRHDLAVTCEQEAPRGLPRTKSADVAGDWPLEPRNSFSSRDCESRAARLRHCESVAAKLVDRGFQAVDLAISG